MVDRNVVEELLRKVERLEREVETLQRQEPGIVVYKELTSGGNPPTDLQLDTTFGDAANLHDGYIGVLHITGGVGSGRRWYCVISNSSWWLEELTLAT